MELKSGYDRFDLEQAILSAWSTKEDVDLFVEKFLDGASPMTEDEVTNYMIGLSSIHEARCEKLFRIFERLIVDGKVA